MAVEVEAAGQVDEFLRVLKQRIWSIIVPFVLIGSFGVFLAVVIPKKYVSKTEVMVHDLAKLAGSLAQNASAVEGEVASYKIESHSRLNSVLNSLRWPDFQPLNDAERYEYIDGLRGDLAVALPAMPRDAGQQLVYISYKNTDKGRAVEFLSKLLDSWTKEVLNRHLEREQKELVETQEAQSDLQKELRRINEEETRIRTEHEIAPSRFAEEGRTAPRPPQFEQFDALQRDIVKLEDEVLEREEALNRQIEKRDRLPQFRDASGPTVADPLTRRIDAIEAKILSINIAIDQGRWSPQNSKRKALEGQIKNLEGERRQLLAERSSSQAFDNSEPEENPQRRILSDKILDEGDLLRDKKKRLTRLQARELELRLETRKLQEAYEDLERLGARKQEIQITLRGLETALAKKRITVQTLDSPQGNPFEILLRPTTPTQPNSPNPWLISIASIVIGLGVGLGIAVLKEYSKNVFRSGREIHRVMPHPVLGTVNVIRTRRERARALLMRGILGGGSLFLVLSVGYVTWAWAKNPEALTDPLVNAIDGFRRLLM